MVIELLILTYTDLPILSFMETKLKEKRRERKSEKKLMILKI